MRNISLNLLFVFLFFNYNFSQIEFEKGYIMSNDNSVIDCYIKNKGWKDNPHEINYKINLTDENTLTATVNNIKEFGINDKLRFLSTDVLIDKSRNIGDGISTNPEPDYVRQKLFLRHLVSGKGNLYSYENSTTIRYFFSIDSKQVQQLVYKKYKNTEGLIQENTSFRKQLFDNIKCETITNDEIRRLNYYRDDLVAIFKKFNSCKNVKFQVFDTKEKREKFNFKIKTGISLANIDVAYDKQGVNIDPFSVKFSNKLLFRLGVEAEYLLPFNKNKWSIIVEPTFHQKYKNSSKKVFQSLGEDIEQESTVSYSFFDIPIGFRHYFHLTNSNKKSAIFFNVFYNLVFDSGNSKIIYKDRSELELNSSGNLSFGLGYQLDKFNFELRTSSPRNILTNGIASTKPSFNSLFAVNLGYTFGEVN